jgi:hypothetical protein
VKEMYPTISQHLGPTAQLSAAFEQRKLCVTMEISKTEGFCNEKKQDVKG